MLCSTISAMLLSAVSGAQIFAEIAANGKQSFGEHRRGDSGEDFGDRFDDQLGAFGSMLEVAPPTDPAVLDCSSLWVNTSVYSNSKLEQIFLNSNVSSNLCITFNKFRC